MQVGGEAVCRAQCLTGTQKAEPVVRQRERGGLPGGNGAAYRIRDGKWLGLAAVRHEDELYGGAPAGEGGIKAELRQAAVLRGERKLHAVQL